MKILYYLSMGLCIFTLSMISFCILTTGCAKVAIEKEMLDGTFLRAEYIRIFDQEISGFRLVTPEGWEISFDQQSADVAIAFKAGLLSAGIGGTD